MNTLKYIMADEGEFDDDNNDIDDDIEEQGEEYSDEELEETELKKEEEEPCDYEVYDDISQESSLTTHNSDIHTSKHLNKYEMARVLGIRTEMLNRGAPPMIDIGDCINTFEIAKRELKAALCPLIISRPLPNGDRVHVKVSSLIIRGI